MCRKYVVKGEALTLSQITERVSGVPQIPAKVTYTKHEIVSARAVLDRLASRVSATNGHSTGIVATVVKG